MTDQRIFLPIGTTVELDNEVYEITGEPIGCGGGSILYPAKKHFRQNGVLQTDGILYVLKECYPAAASYSYTRADTGEITPVHSNAEDMLYLHQAQLMQLKEETISKNIFRTAVKMLPIRKSAQSVALTFPGHRTSFTVPNTMTLMDSLAEKGQSLTTWIKQKRRFAPAEVFRIIQQVLFALQEVHEAGYLHLDIQDGNIFLHGTLEENSELVTLIDFGCARKLIGGKTEPIRDKVIFTTQGFSAPEILLNNDGTLQLGPEADIYSVGCLALYLLTGQRANVRELIANRTGVYLRSNQLRRIQCPKHLIDTMQRILTRALAKDPENRYPSVKEMLEDVTPLTKALQPKSTVLGTVKYDAFVCYKHGPVDSAAALALQRALENYRAPKGVGEKRKPFGRVFVDEGDLSSCADFGQQIRDALKNSEWLIVICSLDTPLSPWVQLEIDTFLEYHDRSRILAVLTGGSPDESFPPQLKGNANGVGEIFAAHAISRTPQEAEKQLKGDALLKIAAPMLNTTFDTLKQRQKIYRLQRIAAITVGFLLASVGFAAYAMNRAKVIAEQAARIEEEYERSLINESLFLAEQAEKKLADNDPIGAMELALQALPSEKQDRPVLPEAEYALGKALGVYKSPGTTNNIATPVGMIKTDCPYYFLNEDGTKLFAWNLTVQDNKTNTYGSLVECWDTETLSFLWKYFAAGEIHSQPLLSSDGNLFLLGYYSVSSINAVTGQENWTKQLENTKAFTLSQSEKELLVVCENSHNQNGPQNAIVLSSSTGDILRSHQISIDPTQQLEGLVSGSPDLRFTAISTIARDEEIQDLFSHNSLYLADLETGNCYLLLESNTEIRNISFIDEYLVVIRADGININQSLNVIHSSTPCYSHWIDFYRISDRTLVWSQKVTDYYAVSGVISTHKTSYHNGSLVVPGLFCVLKNHCLLLDQKTGEIVKEYTLPAAAQTVSLTENGFETVNADGGCTSAEFSTDILKTIQTFGPLSNVSWKNNVYYIQNTTLLNQDHTIRKYQMNWFDDSYDFYFALSNSKWHIFDETKLIDPGYTLLIRENQVCLTELETGSFWKSEIPYPFSDNDIIGVSAKEKKLYWCRSINYGDSECWIDDSKYYVLDFITGNVQELIHPASPHDNVSVKDTVLFENTLYIVATWNHNLSIYSWNLETGTLEMLWEDTISYSKESYLNESLTYDPQTNQIRCVMCEYVGDKLTRLISLDLDTSDTAEIPLNNIAAEAPHYSVWEKDCYQWNKSGTQAALGCDNCIVVVDLHGETLCNISVQEEIISVTFAPDEAFLLAAYRNGRLSKYRIADSEQCATINLADYCNTNYVMRWSWHFPEDSNLIVTADSDAFILDISQAEIKLKSVIDNCYGYDASADRFVIKEISSYTGRSAVTMGSFPRYTVQDLIKKANAVLNN